MPSPFEAAGASRDPSKSAPLHTGRFFTGLWTQRSPLRDAATPYLMEKFYSASRYDSLIGGVNTEITARLTLSRRPGHSVYNAVALARLRMYCFRAFANGSEAIHVMADCASAGAGDLGTVRDTTGPGGNLILSQKIAGSGITFFQSVGNTLYYADGAQCLKWVLSTFHWTPGTVVQPGTYYVDANNNIEWTTAGGVTGNGAEPTWPLAFGALTQDGAVQWINHGSAVQNWGLAGPGFAPMVTQTILTLAPQDWTANTFYNPALALFDPVSGSVQKLVTPGVTASTVPSFSATAGALTQDGAAVWQNQGTGAWVANQGHAAGDLLWVLIQSTGNLYNLFRASTPGISGATQPTWIEGFGSLVQDGGVVWSNVGGPNATQGNGASNRGVYNSLFLTITDGKGGQQQIVGLGRSASSAPNWQESLGALTFESGANSPTWSCIALPANVTAPWMYGYAYKNSVTGHISTASPMSAPIIPSAGYLVVLTGLGSPDQQVDTIRIYRTLQGQATLLFLADIPAPAAGASWSYFDEAPDSSLNPLIEAQTASTNNPPPANLTAPAYYLGRLWGFSGNVLRYSGGPDTLSGVGNEAWPPLNSYTLPSRGVRVWPTSLGLIVFTLSDVYIVQGQGTAASPFYITSFQEGVGLLNYDSFAVNGSTAYLMTTAMRLISFDPGAGETEVGFPIGDIFESSYNAYGTHMAYHEGSSADTALYVADGIVGWYRLSTINAPESGQVWSPQAQPVGGVATVASIEVSPGVKRLLVAPYGPGPLLMRDATTFADNGQVYPANATIGSIVLAQAGQLADVQFLTLDTAAVGSQTGLGLLFNEIAGTFTTYTPTVHDPTVLPASQTITGNRYYMSQAGRPSWCRHVQVQVSWNQENAANELLAYALFGFLEADFAEK